MNCAVEGTLDEAIVRRLLEHSRLNPGTVYGRMGKPQVRLNIASYAQAARHHAWFVLIDLDDEAPCAGELVARWLPDCPPTMAFRVAVREVEAWLLGDRINLARFLSVSRDIIPRDPDDLPDPKSTLLAISRRSRTRALREGLPPRAGSGRSIGPLYVPELSRFASDHWDVAAAATVSRSLARCLTALTAL